MTIYEKELQEQRPEDEIQGIAKDERTGYDFLTTAGHGYLIVPTGDKNYSIAEKIVECGYKCERAIYLEEDSEYGEFMRAIESKAEKCPYCTQYPCSEHDGSRYE